MKHIMLIIVIILLASFVNADECTPGEPPRECGITNEGECKFGLQYCDSGFWSLCFGAKDPINEICNNNKDDNCDGDIDEGCECQSGETKNCGPEDEIGECKFGIESCINNEWSGDCINATISTVLDLCGASGEGNNKDDDCDGDIDEDCTKKPEKRIPASCSNRVKDLDEEKIDCGNVCETCNDCSNGIKEKDEEEINIDIGNGIISDCGGLNCPKCPTCFDKIKNQNEEETDCGGPCQSCIDPNELDEDKDGLTTKEELAKGTNPKIADTDNDGILDGRDQFPICPNGFCDELQGETKKNCPEDCKTTNLPIVPLIIILLIIIGIAFFLYTKYKSTKKEKTTKTAPTNRPLFSPKKYPHLSKRKGLESKSEKALRKTLKK